MPVDLGYSKVFLDIFLRGFALAYLVLFPESVKVCT